MNPANIKVGDLFLAKFAGYPLWPIRILEVLTTNTGDCKFAVFLKTRFLLRQKTRFLLRQKRGCSLFNALLFALKFDSFSQL